MHVFVGTLDKFFDDAIRMEFVSPVVDAFTSDRVETVVYKAKGQAINVAVRAALLLEGTLGAMKKDISIHAETPRPREQAGGKQAGKTEASAPSKRASRFVSSIDIAMTRF